MCVEQMAKKLTTLVLLSLCRFTRGSIVSLISPDTVNAFIVIVVVFVVMVIVVWHISRMLAISYPLCVFHISSHVAIACSSPVFVCET